MQIRYVLSAIKLNLSMIANASRIFASRAASARAMVFPSFSHLLIDYDRFGWGVQVASGRVCERPTLVVAQKA